MLCTRRELLWRAGLASSFGMLCKIAEGQTSPAILYDNYGLIVHKGMDGGDTAQREGWYWLGVWIRQQVLKDPWPIERKLSFPQVIQLLEPKHDGVFCRHPKFSPYDREYGFSRDQMVSLVAAMGVWGMMGNFVAYGMPCRRTSWVAPSTRLTVSGRRFLDRGRFSLGTSLARRRSTFFVGHGVRIHCQHPTTTAQVARRNCPQMSISALRRL